MAMMQARTGSFTRQQCTSLRQAACPRLARLVSATRCSSQAASSGQAEGQAERRAVVLGLAGVAAGAALMPMRYEMHAFGGRMCIVDQPLQLMGSTLPVPGLGLLCHLFVLCALMKQS